MSWADRTGLHDDARRRAIEHVLQQAQGLELVRIGWCDVHGVVRGKTLVASALEQALHEGVGMVSTLMLKDTSDRTAFKVFEPGGTSHCLVLVRPTTSCCCQTHRAFNAYPGQNPPDGYGPSHISLMVKRSHWTPGTCCSKRWSN